MRGRPASDPVLWRDRDVDATLLRLLDLDHRQLSFFHQGLDQKLTGVKPARVVEEVIAQRGVSEPRAGCQAL